MFLHRNGLDTQDLEPKSIAEMSSALADYHVIVALDSEFGSHITEVPFHTVVSEWDLGTIPRDVDPERALAVESRAPLDRRDSAWWIDKGVEWLVFVGGISAIVFIIGIFVFITKEGFGFLVGSFDLVEFFTSPR